MTYEILEARIKALEEKVWILENKKYEKYYQTFLEGHLGKSHKVTKYGITDITTDTHVIEIKPWSKFKNCLGQLKSYNYEENKHSIAALFGPYKKKDNVIQLLHGHGIEVWDLQDTPNGINIVTHAIVTESAETTDFQTWLSQNVVQKQDSLLKLSDVCEAYLGQTVHSSQSNQYRVEIEKFIQNNFKTLKWKYGVVRNNNILINGWKHVCLKLESDNLQAILAFVNSHLTQRVGHCVLWTVLWSKFIDWYKNNTHNSVCNLDKKLIKHLFEENVFKTKENPKPGFGRGWSGWVLQ